MLIKNENNFNFIRMLAAVGVLISHAYPISLGPGVKGPSLLGYSLGAISVYIFFAISGYFITKSFIDSKRAVYFLLSRALRLFPGLFVVLILTIIYIFLFTSFGADEDFWGEAIRYIIRNMSLFKLQYSLPGVFDNNPYKNTINGSLWSLAYEVTCYLTVLIAGIAGFIERRAVFLALSSGGIFCSIIIIEVSQHAELILLAQVFIPFCIGSLLYVFKDFIKMNLFTALSLVLLAIVFSETFLSFFTLMLFVSYSVIYLGFSRSKILFSYNRLGDYSYGFYIYAFPIQQIFASYGISDPFSNIALAAPVTLFFSILSWHFVEYPFLKFKRYFIDRSAI